jgi:hypothetical protein
MGTLRNGLAFVLASARALQTNPIVTHRWHPGRRGRKLHESRGRGGGDTIRGSALVSTKNRTVEDKIVFGLMEDVVYGVQE